MVFPILTLLRLLYHYITNCKDVHVDPSRLIMSCTVNPRIHWTQRVALVRHNLHSARRTNNFSFFQSLQDHALIEGTDHVALLYSALGNDADGVLSTLDNLNAGVAYVHHFIQAQPTHCQDAVANAWITGTTIIADAVSVCLNEKALIEDNLDDFIRLEYSWNCVQSSADSAVSALRGIFGLMAAANTDPLPVVHSSISWSLNPMDRNLSGRAVRRMI
jgi:hypothetical protein